MYCEVNSANSCVYMYAFRYVCVCVYFTVSVCIGTDLSQEITNSDRLYSYARGSITRYCIRCHPSFVHSFIQSSIEIDLHTFYWNEHRRLKYELINFLICCLFIYLCLSLSLHFASRSYAFTECQIDGWHSEARCVRFIFVCGSWL